MVKASSPPVGLQGLWPLDNSKYRFHLPSLNLFLASLIPSSHFFFLCSVFWSICPCLVIPSLPTNLKSAHMDVPTRPSSSSCAVSWWESREAIFQTAVRHRPGPSLGNFEIRHLPCSNSMLLPNVKFNAFRPLYVGPARWKEETLMPGWD